MMVWSTHMVCQRSTLVSDLVPVNHNSAPVTHQRTPLATQRPLLTNQRRTDPSESSTDSPEYMLDSPEGPLTNPEGPPTTQRAPLTNYSASSALVRAPLTNQNTHLSFREHHWPTRRPPRDPVAHGMVHRSNRGLIDPLMGFTDTVMPYSCNDNTGRVCFQRPIYRTARAYTRPASYI
jgi:hypothetical protein